MAPFPKGPKELARAGYIYVKDAHCQAKECGALIHWYKTPTGHWIAIDSIAKSPHWQSCAAPQRFRKKRKDDPPPDPQRNLFTEEHEVETLRRTREPGED